MGQRRSRTRFVRRPRRLEFRICRRIYPVFSGLSDWISFFRKRGSRIDATHFPRNIARGCSVMIYIAPFVYLLETLFPITDPHLFNFSYFHSPNYAKNCVCDLIDDHLAGF